MPSSDYAPSVAEVGALLRARTVDSNGSELGTFTADTRPTDTQAAGLIQTAVGEVSARAGADIPQIYQGLARTASTYRAASLVEISYFPEQVTSGRSPYDQLHTLFLETLESLLKALTSGSDPGTLPGVPAAPMGDFPSAVVPLDLLLGLSSSSTAPPYSGAWFQ